jgi:hypothetical protein
MILSLTTITLFLAGFLRNIGMVSRIALFGQNRTCKSRRRGL